MTKEPPISKVYEALSAIADERIKQDNDIFLVTSSDFSKTYTVKEVGNVYSSNDNATIWQHYSGYPIIAALLVEGKLSYSSSLLSYFKDIPWKVLNTKHKNNYDLAIQEAFQNLSNGITEQLNSECCSILKQLMTLDIVVKGNRIPLK